MTTGRINQNHSTASCPGATIKPHEGVSMASPRWLAVSHALRRTPRGGANPSVTASNHGEPKLSKRPCICMHGPRLVTRRRWTPAGGDLGSMARGGAHPMADSQGCTNSRSNASASSLLPRCRAASRGAPQRDRYNQNGSYPRGGWVDLYSGGCSPPHAVTKVTQVCLRRSRGRGAMQRRWGPPFMRGLPQQ